MGIMLVKANHVLTKAIETTVSKKHIEQRKVHEFSAISTTGQKQV